MTTRTTPVRIGARLCAAVVALVAAGAIIGIGHPAPAMAQTAGSDEPFGLTTEVAPEGPVWAKWRVLAAAIRAEAAVLAACRSDPPRCPDAAATRFLAIIEDARQQTGIARIGSVNRSINLSIRWASDLTQHGRADVWMTPLETFAAGRGDCMDYAIAKYVALGELGVAPDDLRLLIAWDKHLKLFHGVAAVRHDKRWLVLDNRSMVLAPDSTLGNLDPLFSMGPAGVLQYDPPALNGVPSGGRIARVSTCADARG